MCRGFFHSRDSSTSTLIVSRETLITDIFRDTEEIRKIMLAPGLPGKMPGT